MSDLTPEKIAELREVAPRWPVLAALLDKLDALAAVAHEADQLHAAALAAEGELLGDSPEMPRWERLLLNGLPLPELAKNMVDERDQLAAAVERVRKACQEPRYVRNVPESITFEQGYRDALEAILAILDGPHE